MNEIETDNLPTRINADRAAVEQRVDIAIAGIVRPRIVCLCGSTRFYEEFVWANYQETMAGRIVLSVGFFMHRPEIRRVPRPDESADKRFVQPHGQATGCTPEQKLALDELHKRKIDLADEILVLDVNGYIGDSTRSEITYAEAYNKPVRYLSQESK